MLSKKAKYGLKAMSVLAREYGSGPLLIGDIAKQERIRRSERASAAIAKLRRQGKTDHLGRPRKVVDRGKARRMHEQGVSLRAIAAELGVSPMTVQRIVAA